MRLYTAMFQVKKENILYIFDVFSPDTYSELIAA